MTVSDRWLLPDGVEDILPPLAGQIESLRRNIMDVCQHWGYQLVIPPLIEYLESLFTGTGHDLELQTFKLTDQLTGRMMGVRADMTPQAARIDAHTLAQEGITRLCYVGHVLHTRPRHMLTGRTPIQAGCELFGSSSESADMEIISLALEALSVAGLPAIHMDLAHVAIYQHLIADAGFDRDTEAAVFDAMGRKSLPELNVLLGDEAADSAGGRLRRLAAVSGGREALDQARDIVQGASAELDSALDQLGRVADTLSQQFPGIRLGFDFCELRGYNYHTGLVFAAYVPGHGDAVAKGGRYDAIGSDFGRSRPATGFSLDLRALVALGSSTAPAQGAIWAPADPDPTLAVAIVELRHSDTVIRALPEDHNCDPGARGCDRQLVKYQGQWIVEKLG
ncbi:ATP phosphoribosyltransferase regulatory subunit [Marinobacter sp. M3C]|jgi:ATP phosphoribosyltransferase regulatory subunit|uniref:ATP phosphoribosyltransferase regulatory subunit n=1 Tax=unclassified Marinobacter TaxID=83889 RepID=UPI00200BAC8A|nr:MULTISPECIES: ATP phosphoribosyltransferase regulatory subunit [unclassified Marinobacter]MCL1477536.1 ATP phosphoribosyltransferase regulatory subunit [Marinobacter sp.]MCL1481641.1 ATP phosphoribosyltransferase regulatory subunit [Marinobacter sp.]MCL1483350.1 ATP phosphoribosyltransferase regulatory subunit [Marinobacter sp.]MCL1487048.1 ATP phosphoribosyltransferase regulatory subunit [Marinobacter sp.]UQG54725.1 ATP phosphoribosyltransferase regulatory subunit [Marinobacter sp. M4C]